jgi:hypothetical protein
MVEETLITRYHCHIILAKLRYNNRGNTTWQHTLKRNIISFARDPKSAMKLLNTLLSSLESLNDTIAMHFVESSHPPIELVNSCKLLYVCKIAIIIWLNRLKPKHVRYRNEIVDKNVLNTLPNDDILELIIRLMFKSTNIELTNAKHHTNITNLHPQKECNKYDHI